MSNPVEIIPLDEGHFRRSRRRLRLYFPLAVPTPPASTGVAFAVGLTAFTVGTTAFTV